MRVGWVWFEDRFCYFEEFGWDSLKAHGLENGVYETIRVEASSTAPLLKEHLDRILKSTTLPVRRLKEKLSYGRIRQILRGLAQKNGLVGSFHSARLLVFSKKERLVSAVSVQALKPSNGVERIALVFQRREGMEPFFREKTFFARFFLDDQAKHLPLFPKAETVFVSPDGTLLEGAHSAILFLKNKKAFTPSPDLPILSSIGLKSVIRELKGGGIPVFEGRFPAFRLFQADAIYLVNALRGLLPVDRVLGVDGQYSMPC